MIFSFFKNKSPYTIRQPGNLYLASSTIHGMGVFSKDPIKEGTLIEAAPLIVGSQEDYESLSQTALHDYYFVIADKQTPIAIGLGFASWYNHACPANTIYSIDKKKKIIKINARVNIKAEEEITINYHGAFDNNLPVEFSTQL